jgi:hypothetical protein
MNTTAATTTIHPAPAPFATSLAAVARSSVLVDLNISTYSGRLQDTATRDEVTRSKGAGSKRAASVYKSLFADCPELDAITKVQGAARTYHYRMTLPWSDNGSRLLRISLLEQYRDSMNAMEEEFNRHVESFLARYELLISQAAFKLGSLFNRREYPTRSQVARKFSFRVCESPLPTGGDFRLDAEAQLQDAMRKAYEERAQEMLAVSQRDAWERLHKTLTHLSDRLTVSPDGKQKSRIFDTLRSNPLELCQLLESFNVTGDPEMEAARVRLQEAMLGTSLTDLRTFDDERTAVKGKIDAILRDTDWSMIDDDNDSADGDDMGAGDESLAA